MQEVRRKKLESALRSLAPNIAFREVMDFLKSEITRMDKVNRDMGFENKTSEVKGFAEFVEYVTACQAPEPDRDKAISGAGSESAQTVM